jgi:hypothetical protein
MKMHSIIKFAGFFQPVENIKEAVALVRRYHIKSEIIGGWLYCWPSPLIGVQLIASGSFWYSIKYSACIYSGGPKIDTDINPETLDHIRYRLGNTVIVGGL